MYPAIKDIGDKYCLEGLSMCKRLSTVNLKDCWNILRSAICFPDKDTDRMVTEVSADSEAGNTKPDLPEKPVPGSEFGSPNDENCDIFHDATSEIEQSDEILGKSFNSKEEKTLENAPKISDPERIITSTACIMKSSDQTVRVVQKAIILHHDHIDVHSRMEPSCVPTTGKRMLSSSSSVSQRSYMILLISFLMITCSAATKYPGRPEKSASFFVETVTELNESRNFTSPSLNKGDELFNDSWELYWFYLVSYHELLPIRLTYQHLLLSEDYSWCGHDFYNKKRQICCSGIVHNVNLPSSARCCKTDMYYPDRSICLDIPFAEQDDELSCNETQPCSWSYLPELDNPWCHTKISVGDKTSTIFSVVLTPWLKPQFMINMADFKMLSDRNYANKAAKFKKRETSNNAEEDDDDDYNFLIYFVYGSLCILSMFAFDHLLKILHAPTVIAFVCFYLMMFSTAVLYKLVDKKLIKRNTNRRMESAYEVQLVTISEMLFAFLLYCMSTFSMSKWFIQSKRIFSSMEVVFTIITVSLEILLTSWMILLFCDLPFGKFMSFLEVLGRNIINDSSENGYPVPLKDSNMLNEKCDNDFKVDCLKEDCLNRVQEILDAEYQTSKQNSNNDLYEKCLNEDDINPLDCKDNTSSSSMEDQLEDKENTSKTCVKDENTSFDSEDTENDEKGADCSCDETKFDSGCCLKFDNKYKACKKQDIICQTECQTKKTQTEDKEVQCSLIKHGINILPENKIYNTIDRENDQELCKNYVCNNVDADESLVLNTNDLCQYDSSMVLEDHFLCIEATRSIEDECVKRETGQSSTEIIQEGRNIDIHAETSLKTISESGNSYHATSSGITSEVVYDSDMKNPSYDDKDAAYCKSTQCSEPSPDYIHNDTAFSKVWLEADFLVKPSFNEFVRELNSLKSEDINESIDDIKYQSNCSSNDKQHKYAVSIGSSHSCLSYNREHMLYNCRGVFPTRSNDFDIRNVGTENIACNDGYKEVEYCHSNNDDSLRSRDVEDDTPPSEIIIDLQKQEESKARLAPRKENTGRDKKSVSQSLDKEYLQKVVKDTVGKMMNDALKKLSVKKLHTPQSGRRRLTSPRYRRAVRRVLRRAIHHNRNNLSPASVSGHVFPSEQQSNNNTVDNETVVTTPNGALAGISLDRHPIALSVPTSSSSLNNYFTKVLKGYNFDQDERMTYEMLRVQSFQDLPASCVTSPLRMANTGFFSRGNGDEVTCFSCGKQYKNWSQTDLPSEVHRRISPNCRMVKGTDPRNVPIAPQTNAFAAHNSVLDSLPNNASGFIQTTHSTVHQDGDISTPTVPENRPLTRQELDNANVPNRTQQPGRVGVEGQQRRPPQRDQAEELGIVLDRPKYPSYAQLNVRVSTFSGWPGYLDQSPRDMALAGFFYAGYNDYCRCFYCGGGLRNWDAGDDPWVEHARWFPKCSFVRQNRGHRFVEIITKRHAEMQASGGTAGSKTQTTTVGQGSDNSGSGSPSTSMSAPPQTKTQTEQQPQASAAMANDQNESAIQSVRELGYTEQVIRRAIDIMKGNNPGKSKFEAAEILEVVFTITDDETTPTNNAVVSENSENTAISRQQSPNTSNIKQQSQNQRGSQSRQQPQTGSQSRQTGKGKKSKSKQKSSGTANQSSTEMSLPSLSVSSLETANAAGGANLDPTSNPAISDSEIRSLQEENIQLKEQVMCKICMDKNVSIAFLPCGHLACCIDCAPAMRKCPMCRVFIKGTVKTYLA